MQRVEDEMRQGTCISLTTTAKQIVPLHIIKITNSLSICARRYNQPEPSHEGSCSASTETHSIFTVHVSKPNCSKHSILRHRTVRSKTSDCYGTSGLTTKYPDNMYLPTMSSCFTPFSLRKRGMSSYHTSLMIQKEQQKM